MTGSEDGPGKGHGCVRVLLWTLAVSTALLLVAGAAFAVWALNPHRAEPGPLAAAAEDPAVVVERRSDSVLVAPAEDPSGTGVVFYPGARVEPEAYAAVWAPVVARTGATVVVPDLSLNLALLDPARGESAVGAAPGISEWYLGGHSMGGAFAARHLGTGDGETEWAGLILWASFAVKGADLAAREDLRVLSVAGGRDGLLSPEEIDERRPNLPEETVTEVIEGMNHAQFGAYGKQFGDGEPELTDAFGPESGRYLFPDGTPFAERGLPDYVRTDAGGEDLYHRYRVVHPFQVTATTAPAEGDNPGGGIRFTLDTAGFAEVPPAPTLRWLIGQGYVERVSVDTIPD